MMDKLPCVCIEVIILAGVFQKGCTTDWFYPFSGGEHIYGA